jgi:hypothetical protein
VSEKAAANPPDEPSPRRWRGVLSTWPRRIGALALSAAVGWVVTQTLPALWQETSDRAGLTPAPVQVDLVLDPDVLLTLDAVHNPEFVIRRPIEQIGPPPQGESERGRYRWAKAMGGVDALQTVMRLVIRGRGSEPVILHSLEVQKVAVADPLPGTLVSYFGQGAGAAVRYFDIFLDEEPARVQFIGRNDAPAVLFPYQVSGTEVELFDLRAVTLRSDVKWRLLLHYSSAGKNGTITIDDRGQPFETTAFGTATEWEEQGRTGTPPQVGYGWAQNAWWDLREEPT